MLYFSIIGTIILAYMVYGPFFYAKSDKKEFILKWTRRLFLIYILFLIYVLFLNREYTNKITLVPFATINRYFKAFRNHNIDIGFFLENIVGNFFLFAPMGFFYFVLEKNKNIGKNILFILINLGIIFLVEFGQYVTKRGTCDIDDVILNFSGMFIMYLVLSLNLIKRLVNIVFECEIL